MGTVMGNSERKTKDESDVVSDDLNAFLIVPFY